MLPVVGYSVKGGYLDVPEGERYDSDLDNTQRHEELAIEAEYSQNRADAGREEYWKNADEE